MITEKTDIIYINALRIAQSQDMDKHSFAEKLGKRIETVNSWENGTRPVGRKAMVLMAAILGVPESELMKKPGEQEKPIDNLPPLFQ